MRPRPYQERAIQHCLDALSGHRRACVQLPTGSGKSLVLLMVAAQWVKAGKPVYVITPSQEAATQIRSLAAQLCLRSAIEIGKPSSHDYAPILITTYNKAWRSYKLRIKKQTLCILDECHHVNFNAPVNCKILASFQNAIGLSATPWSVGCRDYFANNIFVCKLSESIAENHNSRYEIKPWQEPSKGNYQIIYTNSSARRFDYCRIIPGTDWAFWTKPTSRRVISAFRYGAIGTIIVNRMLTEGFDLPQIKKVYIDRDSHSRIALMQMAGRALRPYRDKVAEIYVSDGVQLQLLKQAIEKAG